MKTKLFLLTPAVCVMMGAPALAEQLVFTNGHGATATFYGQVNLTYQGVDDGDTTYDEFVDNSNSGSRIGLWLDMPMGQNKFRFNFETNLGFKSTADTTQGDDGSWMDWERTDIRKLEGVYSGSFGAVWFGQGSMATDGVAEIDNSGTSVVGYVNGADTAGNFEFRTESGTLSGITIDDAFKDLDGSRRFRIRYDTPDFSGFRLSAAYGEEILTEDDDSDFFDVALSYSLENSVYKVDAGLGYSWSDFDDDDPDDETTERLIASGSLIHIPTGLNLTLAAGDENNDGGSYFYTKVGWNGNVVSYGSTAVSLDYYDGSDFEVSGSSSKSWGLQAVQTFDDYGLEGYLGYRKFSLDDIPDGDFQDISVVLIGARWKF